MDPASNNSIVGPLFIVSMALLLFVIYEVFRKGVK
jgi:hypothetical protein